MYVCVHAYGFSLINPSTYEIKRAGSQEHHHTNDTVTYTTVARKQTPNNTSPRDWVQW